MGQAVGSSRGARSWRRLTVGLITIVVAIGFPPWTTTTATAAASSPVGSTTLAVVDDRRPTPANAGCAKLPSRTLPTTIYYPAVTGEPSAVTPGASPDSARGPYPLIVFAHGYRATSETYARLLAHWASAGYVVAAPTFPLSSGTSPCGAVAGDVVNQPEDMSAVISAVVKESRSASGPLSGLVDRARIGAAGHSNGAITVYGLVANSDLRDERVTAAAILAGTAQRYPTGKYELARMPPVLFVHGTDDDLVPYNAAIAGFNAARGPKGLLTLLGGGHGAPSSEVAYTATTNFFDGFLAGDRAARDRLPDDQTAGVSTMTFAAETGAKPTVPTVPTPEVNLEASVTPRKKLRGGQLVTVSWSGYTPGKVVNVLQCNGLNRDLSNSNECDYAKAALLHPNPTGEGSLQLEIVEGPIGTGTCDAHHQGCFIIVNDASSTDPEASVRVDIAFAR
jgi:dienelactone hydrolase